MSIAKAVSYTRKYCLQRSEKSIKNSERIHTILTLFQILGTEVE
jgi:hypothetical protein